MTEILVQPLRKPYREWEEIVILVVSLAKVTIALDAKSIRPFFDEFLPYFEKSCPNVISDIENVKTLSDDDKAVIISTAEKFLSETNV